MVLSCKNGLGSVCFLEVMMAWVDIFNPYKVVWNMAFRGIQMWLTGAREEA